MKSFQDNKMKKVKMLYPQVVINQDVIYDIHKKYSDLWWDQVMKKVKLLYSQVVINDIPKMLYSQDVVFPSCYSQVECIIFPIAHFKSSDSVLTSGFTFDYQEVESL